MIQGSFKVSKRSSKGVSRQFERCFKEDSRVLKERVKGVSRIFQCFAILKEGLFLFLYVYIYMG